MAGYGDDAGFAAYAEAAGYTVPDGDVPAARQRGSVYIDGTYGVRFPGYPTGGAEQDRAWPRTDATDRWGNAIASDIVPTRVVNAAYEAALIELGKPGSLSATYTPGTAKVLTEVKGIRWQVVGTAGKSGGMIPVTTTIEGLLAPLLVATDYPVVLVV